MQTSRPADVQPREFAKMSRLDIASLYVCITLFCLSIIIIIIIIINNNKYLRTCKYPG